MNKIIALLFISFSFTAFAQEAPISGGGWEWSRNMTLNGRTFLFFQVAEPYREQSGSALVHP